MIDVLNSIVRDLFVGVVKDWKIKREIVQWIRVAMETALSHMKKRQCDNRTERTCTYNTTDRPNSNKQKQFVDIVTRLAADIKNKISKTEQLVEAHLAQRRTNGVQQVQRREGHHGAEESAPRETGAPVAGTLLEGKENASNGRRKGRADARRGTAGHVVATFLVVLDVGRRQRRGHHAARMHHGTFLSNGQTGADRANHTENLAETSLQVTNPVEIDSVEKALDFGNTRASRDGLNPDKDARHTGVHELHENKIEKCGNAVSLRQQVVSEFELARDQVVGRNVGQISHHGLHGAGQKNNDVTLGRLVLALVPELAAVSVVVRRDAGVPNVAFVGDVRQAVKVLGLDDLRVVGVRLVTVRAAMARTAHAVVPDLLRRFAAPSSHVGCCWLYFCCSRECRS